MARAAAQHPEQEQAQAPSTIYEEVWNAVTNVDPEFAPPNENEDDQTFIERLLKAVSELEENLSPAAEQWYERAATRAHQEAEGKRPKGGLEAPPGFYGDDQQAANGADPDDGQGAEDQGAEDGGEAQEEQQVQQDTRQPSQAQSNARSAASERMRQYNEQRRADKAAREGSGNQAAPARQAAPQNRQAPPARAQTRQAPPARQAAPQTQTRQPPPRQAPQNNQRQAPPARQAAPPARQAPPQRQAAPQRQETRQAPPAQRQTRQPAQRQERAQRQPRQQAEQSVSSAIRQYVIAYPDANVAEVAQAVRDQGFNPTDSTVSGVVTFTKNTIMEVQNAGHWKD